MLLLVLPEGESVSACFEEAGHLDSHLISGDHPFPPVPSVGS